MTDNNELFKKYNERFNEIVKLSNELNIIQDFDMLLEKILISARRIVNADAGTIYIKEGNDLIFRHTQNQTLQNRLPKGKKLPYNFFRIPINKKSLSGYCADTGKVLNIPDVYKIPKNTPYHFNDDFDKVSKYKTISMLTVPLKTNVNEICGVLQIINAKNEKDEVIEFSKEDEPFIIHFANTASLVLERAQMTRILLMRMIQMAELRDPKETGAHVNRVASYAVEIYEHWARKRNIDEREVEKNRDMLRMATMLHDVGKIAIPDTILKKPGKLNEEEYEIMKKHTFLGAKLFYDQHSNFDEMAKVVVLNHHENWDGTGYPGHIDFLTGDPLIKDNNGNPKPKKGEEIPIFGRIVAIADVYDALSSKRVYKEAWNENEVYDEIVKLRAKKFDPEIVDIFFDCIDEFKAIYNRYKED